MTAAAPRVGLTRESAYRLRDKAGTGSFVAAWDAALATPPPAPPKFTDSLLRHRAFYGTLKPLMRGASMSPRSIPPENDAFLRLVRGELPLLRGAARGPKGHR